MKQLSRSIAKRFISSILAVLLALTPILSLPQKVSAMEGAGTQENPYQISSAEDVPTEINVGEYYVLTGDIAFNTNQQITTIAGTLDGKGHVIILNGKPLAETVSGTIQNLGITGNVTIGSGYGTITKALTDTGHLYNSYSTVTITKSQIWYTAAGLVGTNSGTISNCYFAGSGLDTFSDGGIAVQCTSDNYSIKNCRSTAGYATTAYTSSADKVINCNIKSEILSSELNTADMPVTGYIYSTPADGTPVLVVGDPSSIPVDKGNLEQAITSAEALADNADDYENWSAVTTALASAREVFASDTATQTEVDAATTTLNNAISALKKIKPTQPVTLPADTSTIKYISSANDLKNYFSLFSSEDSSNNFYVLTTDIEVTSNMYLGYHTFNGTLDGQGHTIKFVSGDGRLFSAVGENGVIQNLSFSGTSYNQPQNQYAYGPLGSFVQGAVINCSTDVKMGGTSSRGYYSTGFAITLDGGVVSNCYSTSDANKGTLFQNCTNGGKIHYSYWLESNEQPLSTGCMNYSYKKSDSYMKSMDFVDLMNAHRGTYGTTWGQSSTGYPYFGENQTVEDADTPLSPNLCTIAYTPEGNTEALIIEDQRLQVNPDQADGFNITGTFSLPDYELEQGEYIQWSIENNPNASKILIGTDVGNLRVEAEGEFIVHASSVKADGTITLLASVNVTSKRENMEDIRLYIDGTNVTNGTYTVQGSEDIHIQIHAKYAGTTEYVDVASSCFTYSADDQELVYNRINSSNCYFLKPGTSTITIASKYNPSITATVTVTSNYVPTQSIQLAIPEEIELHGRNPLHQEGTAFLPSKDGIVITPVNASYSDASNIAITSSNPSVGEFVVFGIQGYVPYKAGSTTYTATLTDTDTTGAIHTYTDSKTVTYHYLNPLVRVTANTTVYDVPAGSETLLDLTYVGARSNEGYNISEPELIWTYSQDGIITIDRKENGSWKRDETAPDNNMFLASSEYYIYAEAEGTVTAVGTPVDTTLNAKPVTITITVTASDLPEVNTSQLIKTGIANASSACLTSHAKSGYSYGDEWVLYALLASGATIPQEQLDAYYQEVAARISTWNGNESPTDMERVALILSLIGKDITNIEGTNLAAMIYNHPSLDAGSNRLTFALLALDARNTVIPKDAVWTRDAIIASLLTYQNSETGGFGIYDNTSANIDSTAMALQALAPYRNSNPAVADAITAGLTYLKANLNSEYGYSSAESGAQVLLALAALDMDLKDAGFGSNYRNLVSHLFSYVSSDCKADITTIQILEAFEAYRRHLINETAYWKHTKNIDDTESLIIISGASSSYTPGTDKTITITCSGKLEELVAVYMDGVKIDPSNYTLKSGSTILTLKADYLRTLSEGNHTVSFEYTGNRWITATITVSSDTVSTIQTGDNQKPELALLALSLSLLGLAAIYTKKRRFN